MSEQALPNGKESALTSASGVPPTGWRVIAAVCSRGRPLGLARALAALQHQSEVPDGWRFERIVAVVNEPKFELAPEVLSAVQGGTPNVLFVHEPDLGLPQARNRAVDEVLTLGGDWIAFTDDDCAPRTNWVAELCHVAARTRADVIVGATKMLQPADARWLFKGDANLHRTTDEALRGVDLATGSCLIAARLFLAPLAMRFDSTLRFTGGEDSDFGLRAEEAGATLAAAPLAIVDELVAPEQTTLRWGLRRYSRAAETAYIRAAARTDAPSPLFWRGLVSAGFHCVLSLPLVALALFGPAGRRRAQPAFKRAAALVGILRAVASRPTLEYDGRTGTSDLPGHPSAKGDL